MAASEDDNKKSSFPHDFTDLFGQVIIGLVCVGATIVYIRRRS